MYVVNALTLAASQYSLPLVDAAAHEDELYGLQSNQLVRLGTGVAEPDLVAVVQTGFADLGSDQKKYVPNLKATLEGDSTTNVWVIILLDGDTIEMGPYALPGRSGPASFVRKWKLAGGVKADNVSLRFEAADGTAWKLQGLVVNAELV